MRYLPFLLLPIYKKIYPVSFFSVFNNSDTYFRYGSKNRKLYKKQMNYTGYVQDHHCIPKQFKNHNVLTDTGYDVNMAYNIKIMPTKEGVEVLNLHQDTRLHYKGHVKYNKYIGRELDRINNLFTLDEKKYTLWLLLKYVKQFNCMINDEIPWE